MGAGALLGAVLAPTDAALSASVVSDASLPQSIRRSLNVESGLNDGIATPVVTALIAAAATVIGVGAIEDTASARGRGPWSTWWVVWPSARSSGTSAGSS